MSAGKSIVTSDGRRYGGYRFSPDLSQGSTPNNAGVLAVEIAAFMGFNPIGLLGYDMQKGQGHFDDDECATDFIREVQQIMMKEYAAGMKRHKPNVKVSVLSEGSFLENYWPAENLEDWIARAIS
jgi:hypothetical protein